MKKSTNGAEPMNTIINIDQINEVYIPEIMRSINDLLNAMVTRHCKVFIVRIDVRFPVGFTHDGTNVLISEWIRRVVGYYGYHKIGCAQLWVREQKTSENPHYHVLLLLNGSLIQNGGGVREIAARTWTNLLKRDDAGPCIHLCQPYASGSGIMIQRPTKTSMGAKAEQERSAFDATFNGVIAWASYLAKTYTKGNAPYRIREFGASRLKAG